MTAANRFSAAGSAIGYLAQVEYALLIALQRMDHEESFRVALETLDDIVFMGDGKQAELWQTKHHIDRRSSISDSSPDLWKSLHNWIETADCHSSCFLFTTATATSSTAISLLRPDREDSETQEARKILDRVAKDARNKELKKCYDKYQNLTDKQRTELLRKITVLDGMTQCKNITEELLSTVRKTIPRSRRGPLVERLRGWWHDRVLRHLACIANGKGDWIEIDEIERKLHCIAQSLRNESLPLDFTKEQKPTPKDVENDNRIFIEQLRLIKLHARRINQAVYDHNRAFLQRSRWQREQLIGIEELEEYDGLLTEQWSRFFDPLEAPSELDQPSGEDKQKSALELYHRLQNHSLPEVRPEMRASYVSLGSLHLLADRLEIGWHPDWFTLLEHRFSETGSDIKKLDGVA